ncbi:MAG: ATP-binding protein [Thermomicrobiales bacterium]
MKTAPGKRSVDTHGLDENLVAMLKHLRLSRLLTDWNETLDQARRSKFSHERFLKHIIERECQSKRENARLMRRQRANIPEMWEIDTFPFDRQPNLDRVRVMSLYDRFDYMTRQQGVILLGPTGCGKTGLGTSFLLQAMDRGYRGYFITFPELMQEFFQSLADRSERRVMRRYVAYDCLLIDEVGYVEVEPAQVGQFFTLLHKRHQRKTTIITSNLGFSDWGSFLKNPQLTLALHDRLTSQSHVVNMKECVSLRKRIDEQS